MIYDCFMFFNEIDLLKYRLNLLYNVVDKFVICESTFTHSGTKKELLFKDNENLFKEFSDKIIHIVKNTNDITAKKRETTQREFIKTALVNCKNDDSIIVSDIDEIPNPEVIKPVNGINILEMPLFYYYLNVRVIENNKPKIWTGAKFSSWGSIKDKSLTDMRRSRAFPRIKNGGWHFSYLADSELIKQKLESFLHHDMKTDKSVEGITKKLNNLVDPFNRKDIRLKKVSVDHLPSFLREQNKYIRS